MDQHWLQQRARSQPLAVPRTSIQLPVVRSLVRAMLWGAMCIMCKEEQKVSTSSRGYALYARNSALTQVAEHM